VDVRYAKGSQDYRIGGWAIHTGRFRVDKTTLAIGDINGNPAVRIPEGDTVKLIANPSPGNKMVDVLWKRLHGGHVRP